MRHRSKTKMLIFEKPDVNQLMEAVISLLQNFDFLDVQRPEHLIDASQLGNFMAWYCPDIFEKDQFVPSEEVEQRTA